MGDVRLPGLAHTARRAGEAAAACAVWFVHAVLLGLGLLAAGRILAALAA